MPANQPAPPAVVIDLVPPPDPLVWIPETMPEPLQDFMAQMLNIGSGVGIISADMKVSLSPSSSSLQHLPPSLGGSAFHGFPCLLGPSLAGTERRSKAS